MAGAKNDACGPSPKYSSQPDESTTFTSGRDPVARWRRSPGRSHATHWLVWLALDDRWATLRADPRFDKLLERVGLRRNVE